MSGNHRLRVIFKDFSKEGMQDFDDYIEAMTFYDEKKATFGIKEVQLIDMVTGSLLFMDVV